MTTTKSETESWGDYYRRVNGQIRARGIAQVEAVMAGKIEPEYDASQLRRHARDAAWDKAQAKDKRIDRVRQQEWMPFVVQSSCRRCGGPVADGSGDCGEC